MANIVVGQRHNNKPFYSAILYYLLATTVSKLLFFCTALAPYRIAYYYDCYYYCHTRLGSSIMSKGLHFLLPCIVGGLSPIHVGTCMRHSHSIRFSLCLLQYNTYNIILFEFSRNNVDYLKAISCLLDEGVSP